MNRQNDVIIVTGSSGLIGSAVVRRMAERFRDGSWALPKRLTAMKKLHLSALLFILAAPLGASPDEGARNAPPEKQPAGEAPAGGRLERLLAGRPVLNRAVTLEEAVAVALRESPVVRGAVEEVEAAAGRLNAARAETRPWASANGFLSGGSNGSIVATPPASQPQMIMGLPRGAFSDLNLMLMYPLSTGGRLSAMVRQAAALRDVSRAELEAQRQEVALLTRAAYREVLARRSLIDVWRARMREDEERLRVDRARLQQEQIPAFYVLRDEAELAASRQELTNAERDAELALVQLQTVMGISPASRIELVGPLEYQPSSDLIARLTASPPSDVRQTPDAGATAPSRERGSLPPDLGSLLRLAERQRPELQAAGQRVRGAEAETAIARSAYRPQVNLFGMGDVMKAEGEDRFAGVTFGVAASLPISNGGQRRARIRTAAAERRRQEAEQERIALQVAQEVNAALLNLRAAEQNIHTSRSALTAAQEDYRVALVRYQSGRSIAVESLDALAARVRAEGNVVQALFQYNVAQDQLLRAVGVLDTPTPALHDRRSLPSVNG